jgi:Rieske Fe-S protein
MTTRREFVRRAALATGALAAVACGGDGGTGPGGTPVTLRVALPAVGETVNVAGGQGGQGIAVTRLSASSVIAVSRRCTHQGCTVGLPPSSLANMSCPCHGSVFTVSGAVVNGPAGSPLLVYPATIDTATSEVVITVS